MRVDVDNVKVFKSTLAVDVPNKKFTIDINVKGVKILELTGEVDWTLAASNIIVRAVINGNKNIELVAKRQGYYENIDYALEIFGDKITFVSVNKINSAKDF